MRDRPRAGFRIEAFDPAFHDRKTFSSGVEQVDNFFRHTANKLMRARNLRVFVLVSAQGDVAGFHALNAHAIDYSDLPAGYARTRPRHGSIPAGFVAMIGVDGRFQNQGHGGVLLADALRRIERAGEHLGIAVAVLDVLDCGDRQKVARRKGLYESHGFRALPSNPLRLMLPVQTIGEAFRDN